MVMTEQDLDLLLAEARRDNAAISPGFMARLLEDALAAQPAPAPIQPAGFQPAQILPSMRAAPRWRSLWTALSAGFGGGGVVAGLCGAAVLGLWVGYADPGGLTETFTTTSEAGLEIAPAAEYFLTGG